MYLVGFGIQNWHGVRTGRGWDHGCSWENQTNLKFTKRTRTPRVPGSRLPFVWYMFLHHVYQTRNFGYSGQSHDRMAEQWTRVERVIWFLSLLDGHLNKNTRDPYSRLSPYKCDSLATDRVQADGNAPLFSNFSGIVQDLSSRFRLRTNGIYLLHSVVQLSS